MSIVLITGGSRGLGRDAALKLAAKGVDVIITYHSHKDEGLKVVEEIKNLGRKSWALQLDISKIKTLDDFVLNFKDVLEREFQSKTFNYLLNNAGMGINSAIAETTEEQFDLLMNTHFKGVFFLTQKLLPFMADGGRILNVSSGLARFSFKGYSVYGSLKGAVDVMTRYMALELGSRNIGVNSIAPGAIATDFGNGVVRDNTDVNSLFANQTALGRVGVADDIGDIMAELLAGKTNWINGQRIEASGGFYL